MADDVAVQLQTLDPERWLTVLLAPRALRPDLIALYGFNLEIAKIREITREPLIGAMRLQWWRDVIEAVFAGAKIPHHGLAQLLAATIRTHALPRAPFDRLLDARELDLEPEGPADLTALDAYARATGGGLCELAVRILGVSDAVALDAARAIGTGWALLGIVRATPFLAGRRQTMLPADQRGIHGVTTTSLFEARAGNGIRLVVEPIAHSARRAFEEGRAMRAAVPRRARSPLLLATLADAHLADLARAGYDPFQLPEPRKDAALRLAFCWLRGRF
ncbi:phytoene/squalene synthase family protein [Roseiterribacter gracilis]|uniref:phytoene/squalene synthase family protein n=1 Tax=Roseiterribacter gracilis TaxID=2812848 RepID=UPI003B4382E5